MEGILPEMSSLAQAGNYLEDSWLKACFNEATLDKYGKLKDLVKRLCEAFTNEELHKAPIINTLVEKLSEALRNEGLDNPVAMYTLGRANFAAGVAALFLFLSPYVKSPITVRILGGWGMGKSSVMLQFRMYDHKKHSFSKYSGGGHMNIMTVFYNAWHYRDEREAWAGLAVEIRKEIESAMTGAQSLSTCWRYASTREQESFYLQLILPSLIAVIVAVGAVVVAWILLSTSNNKMLSGFMRYGSIPATLVGISWVVMKSAFSILKPVSSQMAGYMRFPDHTSRLGYQQKVIDGIIFLKEEIGREPKLFCSLIANTWFGLCQNNVAGTAIPKVRPTSGENLRIVVFVDDLDRCHETVILKVLSAINLLLAACQIDAVLGIDNKMIERAVRKEFAGNV